MATPVLTFFNNKGGVGKTSLVYHLAWMFTELGKTVVVSDLDPQANLTLAFLSEDQIEPLINDENDEGSGSTIFRCIQPLTQVGDIRKPRLQCISGSSNLHLIPGDVGLSNVEDILSEHWPKALDSENLYRPMRVLSAFWQIVQMAAGQVNADIILVDIGPNLGVINRSVMLATDYVAIPLGADLFSLQGLKNLGPAIEKWKRGWKKRLGNWQEHEEEGKEQGVSSVPGLPAGGMKPIGYLCQQHSVRLSRPVMAYDRWVKRMPAVYRSSVLGREDENPPAQRDDPLCLGTIKHYRSLVPMAQEHRKPIFALTAADGAIGSHAAAAHGAGEDFRKLAIAIADKIGMSFAATN